MVQLVDRKNRVASSIEATPLDLADEVGEFSASLHRGLESAAESYLRRSVRH